MIAFNQQMARSKNRVTIPGDSAGKLRMLYTKNSSRF
jgi:hypothetical protein